MWKVANIIPIAKKSNAVELGDYRPISILPALSKAFEKILAEQITDYISKKRLLSPLQSGFRVGHSCTTAMLKIMDDIRVPLDNKQLSMLCLLDFSKAFDSVNHSLLCSKLRYYFHFDDASVKLLASYLCNRQQRVCIRNEYSSMNEVRVGVPQGSTLGPLLFVLFINDIFYLNTSSLLHAFADDVQLYTSNDYVKADVLVTELNHDLRLINSWARDNCLVININKCMVLPIYYKCIDINELPIVSLGNIPLKFVTVVRNLGFVINSKLSSVDHVSFVISKIYTILRCLRMSGAFTPLTVKRNLVLQLVMPHLQYFCLVYSRLDSFDSRRICVVFNSTIRYIYSLRRYDHVSHLSRLLLSVDILAYFEIRNVLYLRELLNNRVPFYLFKKLSMCRSVRNNQILIPRYRHLNSSRLFFVNAVRLWNALPLELRSINNRAAFRRALYGHYTATLP